MTQLSTQCSSCRHLLVVFCIVISMIHGTHLVSCMVQGDCGQSSCAPADCKWPEKFGGFKEGTCASVGYTVADGTQTVKIPIIGKEQTYSLFKKPSETTN